MQDGAVNKNIASKTTSKQGLQVPTIIILLLIKYLLVVQKGIIFLFYLGGRSVQSGFAILSTLYRKGYAVPEYQQHIFHCKAISDNCVSSLNAPRDGLEMK